MDALALFLVLASSGIHAAWNLLAHASRANHWLFLRATFLVAAFGLPPAVLLQWETGAFPPRVWGLLVVTGMFQAVYYLGLAQGYARGQFTIVYPVARSLPILLLAAGDVVRGVGPSPQGWAGLGLVAVGCVVMPLDSLRTIRIRTYWNRTLVWALVAALGTTGYTMVDKLAADALVERALSTSPLGAGCYMILIAVFTLPWLGAALRLVPPPGGIESRPPRWREAAALGALMYGAYGLVLWAYQLTAQASYIVAVRQFSIVLGVTAGTLLFHEAAPRLRIGAALLITAGVAILSRAA